jgi:cytidylate kinase
MGKRKKIVIEGRDITTVVFPDAEIKIFMTADINVRAKRRFEDMKRNNPEITYSDVLENLSERDSKDSNRKDSPLRIANDAIVIDTSDLEINEQAQKIIDIIKNKF